MKNTYEEMLKIEKQKLLISSSRTYRSFDAYVAENPNGEIYRNWITNFGQLAADALLIFSGEGMHQGIPGGFLWARLARGYVKAERNKFKQADEWYIHIHDCDDGFLSKEFPNKEEALAGLDEIEGYTPVSFDELRTIFGYSL